MRSHFIMSFTLLSHHQLQNPEQKANTFQFKVLYSIFFITSNKLKNSLYKKKVGNLEWYKLALKMKGDKQWQYYLSCVVRLHH